MLGVKGVMISVMRQPCFNHPGIGLVDNGDAECWTDDGVIEEYLFLSFLCGYAL